MDQNERGPTASHSRSPGTLFSTSLSIVAICDIEKRYFREIAALCREAADTNNPAVIEATIQIFETVPRELRRMRRERTQSPRLHARRGLR